MTIKIFCERCKDFTPSKIDSNYWVCQTCGHRTRTNASIWQWIKGFLIRLIKGPCIK